MGITPLEGTKNQVVGPFTKFTKSYHEEVIEKKGNESSSDSIEVYEVEFSTNSMWKKS